MRMCPGQNTNLNVVTGCNGSCQLIRLWHCMRAPTEDLQPSQTQRTCSTTFKMKNRFLGTIVSWNVRTVFDNEVPVETARQGRDTAHGADQKTDEVVKELCEYGVKVVGLQATKWFGSAVHHVSGCVVLAAGRQASSGQ